MKNPENVEDFERIALSVVVDDRLVLSCGDQLRVLSVRMGLVTCSVWRGKTQVDIPCKVSVSDVADWLLNGKATRYTKDEWEELGNARLVETLVRTINEYVDRLPPPLFPNGSWALRGAPFR